MQTLRIFISSPGDVLEESQHAGRVIERLQGKYWSFVRLDDVFWEYQAVRATAHYQEELVNPGTCDIVLGVLWTRLGSPLPDRFRSPRSHATMTGTEWELEQAFAAYEKNREAAGAGEAKPDILVYRRRQLRPVSDDPAREIAAAGMERQLEDYLKCEYFYANGTIKRPVLEYRGADEFESLLYAHLLETLTGLDRHLLIQIDQLEEAFTHESVRPDEREAFFRAISALSHCGRVWTLATMRSEFFPLIATCPSLHQLVQRGGGYILQPPADNELREIVRYPAFAARLAYQKGLAITKKLADLDPGDTETQLDLGICYERLASAAQDEGDLKGAREAGEQGMAIRKRLAESTPGDARVRQGLAVSHGILGDIAMGEDNLKTARAIHEKCLVIRERLAGDDPDNALAQVDLSFSHMHLGDIANAEGDLESARIAYEKAMIIRKRLADADPHNAEMWRNLSACHNRLGDIAKTKGDLKGAREAYGKALAIRLRLVEITPKHVGIQRDLSASYSYLAAIDQAGGDLKGARENLEKCLPLRQRLADAAPDSAQALRDLLTCHSNFCALADKEKNPEERNRHRRESLRILKLMEQSKIKLDPSQQQLYQTLKNEFPDDSPPS